VHRPMPDAPPVTTAVFDIDLPSPKYEIFNGGNAKQANEKPPLCAQV
jgi:hypothetical protein